MSDLERLLVNFIESKGWDIWDDDDDGRIRLTKIIDTHENHMQHIRPLGEWLFTEKTEYHVEPVDMSAYFGPDEFEASRIVITLPTEE